MLSGFVRGSLSIIANPLDLRPSAVLGLHVHSVAIQIGGFAIYWYGILVAAGFLAGFFTASRRAPLSGISSEAISGLAPWIVVGTIVGARMLYVISYWQEEFAGKPLWEITFARRSGMVFYGGLIGASLATILYARVKKLPLWKLADVMAPSIALGHFFGRLGCLMTGCCYGRPTELPWAIHFPKDHWTHGARVHPTQIYESLLNLALLAGLSRFYRVKKFDGQIFSAYLLFYAMLRALVECFRGDYPVRYVGGWVTPAQLVSVGIFTTGAVLWYCLRPAKAPRTAVNNS